MRLSKLLISAVLLVFPIAVMAQKDLLGTPPIEAVALAIKANDLRYLSAPLCITTVPGVPTSNPQENPFKHGVKDFGPTCDELFGPQSLSKVKAINKYVDQYNNLMYEHLQKLKKP